MNLFYIKKYKYIYMEDNKKFAVIIATYRKIIHPIQI